MTSAMALDHEEPLGDSLLSDEEGSVESSRRGTFKELGRTFKRLAGVVARTAASAGEMLKDEELRKRGATVIAERARTLQQGVVAEVRKNAANVASTFQKAPKSIQGVLGTVQSRINEARLRARLEATKDTPVAVQVGLRLYKAIPQEWRSRLWLTVLYKPEVTEGFREIAEGHRITIRNRLLAAHHARASDTGVPPAIFASTADASPTSSAGAAAPAGNDDSRTGQGVGEQEQRAAATPSSSDQAASGSSAEGGGPAGDQPPLRPTHVRRRSGVSTAAELAAEALASAARQQQNGGSQLPEELAEQLVDDGDGMSSSFSGRPSGVTETGELGDWEVLQGDGGFEDRQGCWLLMHAGRQTVDWSPEATAKQDALELAVDAVQWPAATEYDPEGRYSLLLQITTGQEEVDEPWSQVIARDIHRTFPEHPQFGFEQGQQELFRVLKAYSVHDLEVGYCQGMAFVAGILLMYLPEEPTFHAISRLFPEGGANLRRLYLPTMEGLKAELRKFEWLMAKFLPALLEHLESHGVVSVLFAAQWFLTAFSCPFPPAFSSRVIDIMLVEDSDAIMQRAALAVMAECAADLMQLDDFEEIITFLKMQLAGWTGKRARRVLNSAYRSPITNDILGMADEAVRQGFTGSLSRVQSSVDGRGVSAAGELEGELGTAGSIVHGMTPSTSGVSLEAAGAAGASGTPTPGGRLLGSRRPSSAASKDEEAEYLRMVMNMEAMWTTSADADGSDDDASNSSTAALPKTPMGSAASIRGLASHAAPADHGAAAAVQMLVTDGAVSVTITAAGNSLIGQPPPVVD